MKLSTICFLILLIPAILIAESGEQYSQIKVLVPDRTTLDRIWKTGIDFEGSRGKIGGWMEFTTNRLERQRLTAEGIQYEVIKDDISLQSEIGYISGPVDALGFGFGSMSGFYTYSEVLKQLDSMRILFPNLITARDSIGYTHEGRAIWAVKISDYPSVAEDNEPEALYTALHHAREPEGMMTVIYYMWWLLQNYGTDTDAAYLVNNRQMWFIPVVNPDGYCYNESLYRPGPPVYFGSWRKNRRNNGGSYGVDLNRNYGTYEMWNGPNGGSSTYPSDDTYRGPEPFSEPETFAIDEFMWSHNIQTCLNYHTYGNYLIFPWGYLTTETDDSLNFREFAFDMVSENRYTTGTDQQTVNYSTRGNSDDFMYSGTMTRTYAMTPEVGTSGFWPPTNEILPLAIKNLSANRYLSYVAGQYTILKRIEINDPDNDGQLTSGEIFTLSTTIRNKGLKDAENLTVTISSSLPGVTFGINTITLSSMLARSDSTVNFSGMVKPDCPMTSAVNFYFTFTSTYGYFHRDTASTIIGSPIILLDDSANTGTGNWNIEGTWGITSNSHTPPYSFTESPSGYYSGSAHNFLTLSAPLDLTNYDFCTLKFWTKWAIEPTTDFAKIEVSSNNGSTWKSLRSKLSRPGSGYGIQYSGTWGYDGYTPGLDWVEQEIDLSQFKDQLISLRFSLISDGSDNRDGWYIDDIRIVAYRPAIPILRLSDNGAGIDSLIFGELTHSTAGIDSLLGERELPPKPSPGTFDSRWRISGTNGTILDMRDTLGIDNSSNQYIAEFQPGPDGYPFTLRWNPQSFSRGGWHMRDGTTHGTLLNINMLADTGVIITNDAINCVEITHTMLDTIVFPILSGWSMVSVPMMTNNRMKSQLYVHAVSDAFAYQGSYVAKDTLEYGKSYWIKYSNADTIQYTGIPITRDTIQLPTGWSMIGGLGCPTLVSQMKCDPPPCRLFGYNGSYNEQELFNPGEGFWIKGPRNLIISCIKPSEALEYKINSTEIFQSFNSITISDNSERGTKLYFGLDMDGNVSLADYELPPVPPEGSFDVRFASQRMVELFSSQTDKTSDATILIQSSSYPIKIDWNVHNTGIEQFELTDANGYIGIQSMLNEGSMLISNPDVKSVTIKKIMAEFIPVKFTLYRNYPNPFNPSTTIQFDLPARSAISLNVFNVVGQQVESLISNQAYAGGRYYFNFDGSKHSSGVYFYRLTAQPLDGNPIVQLLDKMLLVK